MTDDQRRRPAAYSKTYRRLVRWKTETAIDRVTRWIIYFRDAMTVHLDGIDDNNVSDAELIKTNKLNTRIKEIEAVRKVLIGKLGEADKLAIQLWRDGSPMLEEAPPSPPPTPPNGEDSVQREVRNILHTAARIGRRRNGGGLPTAARRRNGGRRS